MGWDVDRKLEFVNISKNLFLPMGYMYPLEKKGLAKYILGQLRVTLLSRRLGHSMYTLYMPTSVSC